MRYPDDVVEEVRLRNDIVDVISSYIHIKKMEILIHILQLQQK